MSFKRECGLILLGITEDAGYTGVTAEALRFQNQGLRGSTLCLLGLMLPGDASAGQLQVFWARMSLIMWWP